MINPHIVLEQDMGDDGMQCINHPYKQNPGGICAFCLQEKLGKLVSSSFPLPSSSSSSSSASFRSENYGCPTSEKHKKVMGIVYNRSKSTSIPRKKSHLIGNGFWSFLHISSKSSNFSMEKSKKGEIFDNGDGSYKSQPNVSSKVLRSRSIGCGNRSFSNDFSDKLSNGFGDCALRRVESQREGKSKISSAVRRSSSGAGGGSGGGEHYCMKERVKCGGIFSGFVMNSPSSSSFSSSTNGEDINGRSLAGKGVDHGRNRSWGWGFGTPTRAISKTSKEGKRVTNPNPNLAGIPSLLIVR